MSDTERKHAAGLPPSPGADAQSMPVRKIILENGRAECLPKNAWRAGGEVAALDRDRRLVGKDRHQLDLLVGEGPHADDLRPAACPARAGSWQSSACPEASHRGRGFALAARMAATIRSGVTGETKSSAPRPLSASLMALVM